MNVYRVAERRVNFTIFLSRILSDIPSENADMSNDKGFYPRLKLMVFINQRPLSLYTT